MPTYLPDSPVQTHYALGKGVYSAGTEEERFALAVSVTLGRRGARSQTGTPHARANAPSMKGRA